MLVLHSLNIRILHQLCIKAYDFKAAFCDVDPSPQAIYPYQDVVTHAFDAWRKPAILTAAIV